MPWPTSRKHGRSLAITGTPIASASAIGRPNPSASEGIRTARALLMPSLAEGFGLPMAEALALGVPVIASDLPCFREVGQGIPCLLDPYDVDGWAARISAFDRAAAQRQRRIDALRGYCPPRWDDHFEQVDPWMATLTRIPVAAPRAGPGRSAPAGCHIDLGTAN